MIKSNKFSRRNIKKFIVDYFSDYRHNLILLLTDSYKVTQYLQYPENTDFIYSYIESRGGEFKKSVVFGLQGWIKEYLIDNPITMDMINDAADILDPHGFEKFNRKGWEDIVNNHNGQMPIRIRAVPEGTVIDVKNVIATVINTHPDFYWLTSYIETAILRAIWYGTTVASNDFEIKNTIRKYMMDTTMLIGDELELDLMYRLHDFGGRGVSSTESAGIGGCAHLVNFAGTDTLPALLYAKKYYGAYDAGHSIDASEHSTITSWTRSREINAYENMINKFAGQGKTFACVSDSYDIFEAIRMWGTLKDKLIEKGGRLVIRPDSGLPAKIVLQCLELMEEVFGMSVNERGYKVLPDYVRLIQGDGINRGSIKEILETFTSAGYSAENVFFGMGGAMLQKVDRDTMKFAMKCSAAFISGEWVDVFKDPITDPGKTSKKGIISLFRDLNGDEYSSRIRNISCDYDNSDELDIIWENGIFYSETDLETVRGNAIAGYNKIKLDKQKLAA